jgi:hypothetical protein
MTREEALRRLSEESLGRLVREVWVKWAREQPDVGEHPNWVLPWEALGERDREVDRRIGQAVAGEALRLVSAVIESEGE